MRADLLLLLGALHLLLCAAVSKGQICSTSCNTDGTDSDRGGGNCVCKSNVRGDCCDQCAENTYRLNNTLANCVSCKNCVTAASNCSELTGACICMEGVIGQTCDKCESLYYNTRFEDSSTCTKCPCNANGTIDCDLLLATGSYSCTCKSKADGTLCDRCDAFHYPVNGDYGRCTSCRCNEIGTSRCLISGECVCKTEYNGTKCKQCVVGYYASEGKCSPCSDFCHVNGTRNCTDVDCICKPKSNGMNCQNCDPEFYAPSNEDDYVKLCTVRGCKFEKSQWCQDCTCNPLGSSNMQCSSTGHCTCKSGVLGPKCDSCPSGQIFNRSGTCEDPANFLPFGTNIASPAFGYGNDVKVNPSTQQYFKNIVLPLNIPIRGRSDAHIYNYLTISSNGYVSVLDFTLPNAEVSLENLKQTDTPIIAPLWSNYDGSLGEVYYQLHTDSKTIMDTAQLLAKTASFTPQYVLKVTWAAMRVNPSGQDAAQSDLNDLGANNVQLLVAWDDCVSFSIFLYNAVSWTTDRNSREIISRIWDGERLLLPISLDTSSVEPFVANLTPYPCSGYLLDKRMCKRDVGSLSAVYTSLFFNSYSARACPPTGFLNKALPRIQYYLRDHGFSVDCVLRQRTNQDWYAPVCCYDRNGSPIVGGSRGGWVTSLSSPSDLQTELSIRNLCCRANLCGLFYAKLPRTSGGFSCIAARLWGDPHLTTLDGADYTFNGYGEYRLISADDPASNSRSVVQVRTTPLPNTTATVLTHAAVGLYNLSNSALLSSIFVSTVPGGFSIVVDNTRNITEDVFKLNITGPNVQIFQANELLTFSRTSERDFSVSCFNNLRVGFAYINITSIPSFAISPAVPPTLSGGVVNGLLGVYNGNSLDDFLSRNGTLLSVNSTEKELFHNFGQTWQITPDESLFVYGPGLGPNNYSHPEHIPVFTNELVISDEVRQACQGNTACMFDAASTNDTMVGLSTMRTGEMLATERVLLGNVPPSITGDFRVNATIGKWVITSIMVTDTDDFNVTFLGGSQMPRNYNFTRTMQGFNSSTYTLYWMPDVSDRNLSLRFQATDSRKASSLHYVLVVFCPCANDQPCSVLDPEDDGGESRFVRLTCICNDSYSGDDCSADRNGCTSGPGCFIGANCTDNPAPATGATCGPCPSGLTGDGATCSDILECSALPGPCALTAICTELFGSFRCNCESGYRGDGTVCTDIDECTDGTHTCTPLSTCINKQGYFNCRCNDGYFKNGTACLDEDECTLSTHNCNNYANCTNTIGSFTCKCLNGFTGDGYLCTDINECLTGSACGANGYCSNVFGSFTCSCLTGYTGSGTDCTDIDECAPTNPEPPCDANGICTNTAGRYLCACRSGYKLNGEKCRDVDECATTTTNNCSTNAACQNSIGAYSCACNSGYTGSGDVCTRIVCPAYLPNGVVTPASTPIYPGVRVTFSCNTGYTLNISARAICRSTGVLSSSPGCIDDDECATAKDNCHSTAVCRNIGGSFVCVCPVGHSGDGLSECKAIDECSGGSHNCSALATCTDITFGFICTCTVGFTGDGTACNVVTCPRPTIPNGQVSGDVTRPFNINEAIMFSCNSGYRMNGTATSTCLVTGLTSNPVPECKNINECENRTLNSCDGNATCVDRPGNYTCRCQAGYAGSGFLTRNGGQLVAGCQNVDECTLGTHSCQQATCTDTIGSFSCTCLDGFTGDGNCTDIDECSAQSAICPAGILATCNNTIGSYRCSCIQGYSGNGSVCTNINECNDGSHTCDSNATCSDTAGSFSCICNPGYTGDGQQCSDYDECRTQSAICPAGVLATCSNTIGSYQCICIQGYSGNETVCTNINECIDGSHTCDSNATCSDTAGSFSCNCNPGYTGDGQQCSDYDECGAQPGLCAAGVLATCNNTIGSYQCICIQGYSGNGSVCTNINECNNGSHTCDSNATCSDTAGSFSCQCNTGFTGDGQQCTDIDECSTRAVNCTAGVLAICSNTIGSYRCTCIEGYSGNGSVCTIISCPRPSAPTNGQISGGNFNFSNVLTFSCNTGFRVVGNTTAICLATGLASNPPPTCQVIDPCADGSHDCASNATCTTTSTSFSCKCNMGYVGNGQACTAISCQRPSRPASGQVSGEHFNFSNVLTFSCSPGYRLVGSTTTTCLATRLASNPPPTCQNINECVEDSLNNCDANAHCNDKEGAFTCSCREGYAGTGVVTRNESGIVPGCEKESGSSAPLSGAAVAGISCAAFAVGVVICFLLIPWYKQHRARKSRDRKKLREVLVGSREMLADDGANSMTGRGDHTRGLEYDDTCDTHAF